MRHPMGVILAQRGHLFPWVPVCLAIGIGAYFSLAGDPSATGWLMIGAALLCLGIAARFCGPQVFPLCLGVGLVLSGVCLAGFRANHVAAPVLGYRYYGPVEGRIVAIDRSVSDQPRLTLDRVVLHNLAPDRTPARVRITLHGDMSWLSAEPGLTVILTANLSPPAGPVAPYGFDFQRMAWFQRLGAVGYSRTPALVLAPAEQGRAGLMIHRLRLRLSAAVQSAMPEEEGAFAAALMTGDRSGMSQATLADLRASNLAHLLAISGLHMGLLTAFIFGSLRYGLSLFRPLALRIPVKKLAAGVALVAAAGYLALSGGNVATERAFVMVAVMLGAVLADRRALTLRGVAIAALIILLLHPEALIGPGFQMSFAATTALVAVFGALRGRDRPRLPAVLRPLVAVVLSSAVAGAATAPIAAAHFNQISHFGLLANLLTVPLMGAVVIPAAVVAACLAPFGLAWLALEVMRWGLVWILGVARYVAHLDGAVSQVVSPAAAVLPVFALGMLWLILWQGWLRWGGVLAVAVALGLWVQTERPMLLVSGTGGLVGVLTDQGRVLSKPKGDGFSADNWLEDDGDPATQLAAFERGVPQSAKGRFEARIGLQRIVHLSGKGAVARAEELCRDGIWIFTAAKIDPRPDTAGNCTLWDAATLRKSGALAAYDTGGALRLVSAKEAAGRRLWNTPQRRQ
ncbi:ComEC/Rec2 family competence protein [Pseudogemmobacter sp. W21_MBD1_M6]|uniref:ComEC/Rec2 family competence protein n=1 Tax=Pseudogemmobacter sp. W21_MBD1_M6 TaxID=3240271 RepID=UPI003F946EAB